MQEKDSKEHAESVSIDSHSAVSGRLGPRGAFRVWGKILIGFLGKINPEDRSYAYRDLKIQTIHQYDSFFRLIDIFIFYNLTKKASAGRV